ncbi:hypothetical protein BCR34DRAFT_627739 [Clohesyomyces aquaticus]|uniref:Uncharacterized protein n=1 Tax=Clohesyomyces aquaticus TaxID=1231657 RepID=A0A1Y1YUJ0_9PLEO|nr:hypothetical protein BCR34DRAFT_627739 [Clohesyomyces aquaticus]
MKRHIVAVEPASGDGPVVVLEVRQRSDSRPLDVDLIGCEEEYPYVATIQQRDIGKLQKNFKGSSDEWNTLLSHFLLQQQPEDGDTKILDGVRMVYSLTTRKKLEIVFRQDVQGIKVTLGEIVLPCDEEAEILPFEWAQVSAQAHALALSEIAELKSKLHSKQSTVDKLNAQLEDFIKTKNESDTAMLQQFMELLNEKKRKIRDQQRLLAGAKVDKTTATAVQAARKETKPRKAGPSRASKRKASAKAAPPEPVSDSDQMEIDEAKVEEADDAGETPEPNTPDQTSDEETEDESPDSAPASSAPLTQSHTRGGSGAPGRANTTVTRASREPSAAAELPHRELRSKPGSKLVSPPPAHDDDDDETEDEEL